MLRFFCSLSSCRLVAVVVEEAVEEAVVEAVGEAVGEAVVATKIICHSNASNFMSSLLVLSFAETTLQCSLHSRDENYQLNVDSI